MAYENWVIDAVGHFGSGIAVSAGSNMLYRKANPLEDRVRGKKECCLSIEVILDSQPMKNVTPTVPVDGASTTAAPAADDNRGVPIESFQYAQNVMSVREYLASNGNLSSSDNPLRRAWTGVKSVFTGDRINKMGPASTAVFAIGMETIDSITGIQFYAQQVGESPLGAVWRNSYQVPAFIAGLYVGRFATRALQWSSRSSEEKEFDRRIEQLLKQTDIVDIVMNYEPSESVRRQIQREGLKMVTGTLTGAGHKLAEGARSAVAAIGASGEKRRALEAQAKDERQQRFQDIVNGR